MGPPGSSKTALVNLIARFWDVDEGSVLLGGVDVREGTAESLLTNISMVFQNVYLFNDTIGNYIKFGIPEATRKGAWEPVFRRLPGPSSKRRTWIEGQTVPAESARTKKYPRKKTLTRCCRSECCV